MSICPSCCHHLTPARQFHSPIRRDSRHARPPLNLLQRHQSSHSTNRSETLFPGSRSGLLPKCDESCCTRGRQIKVHAQQHCDNDLIRCLLRLLSQHIGFIRQHQPSAKHQTPHRRNGRRSGENWFKSPAPKWHICSLRAPSSRSRWIVSSNPRTKNQPWTDTATIFDTTIAGTNPSLPKQSRSRARTDER